MPRQVYNTKNDKEKAEIIKQCVERLPRGETLESIARNFSVAPSTLRGWLAKREEILRRAIQSNASKKFRDRSAKFKELEDKLFQQWCGVQNQVNTDGNFLRQRVNLIASEMKLKDFKASNQWLNNFKKRYNLTVAKACGSSSSADWNQLLLWLYDHRAKLAEYAPDDIFNADETGLFYRLLPSRTLCVKGTKCHGGSQSKERVSILLCVNMTGTEKLTPLVIGIANGCNSGNP